MLVLSSDARLRISEKSAYGWRVAARKRGDDPSQPHSRGRDKALLREQRRQSRPAASQQHPSD